MYWSGVAHISNVAEVETGHHQSIMEGSFYLLTVNTLPTLNTELKIKFWMKPNKTIVALALPGCFC